VARVSNKPRIMIDVTRPASSGIGRYSWNLLEHLSRNDRNYTYAALTSQEQADRAKQLVNEVLIIDRPTHSLQEIKKLSEKVDRLADVFVATHFSTQLLLQIPIIQVVHDIIYVKHVEWQPTLEDLYTRHGQQRIDTMLNHIVPIAKEYCNTYDGPWRHIKPNIKEPSVGNIFKYIFSYYILSANAIITPSSTVMRELQYYYPGLSTAITTIYPPVPEYLGNRRRSVKRFAGEILRLLYVANIETRKNHTLLFDALEQLNERFNGKVHLSLIGRRHYDSHFSFFRTALDHISKEHNVTLKSDISDEDLASCYRTSDIFVFPSLEEGFGIPLLEAMYVNLPIVALRTPVVEEVCQDAALFIDHPSAPLLAQKIIQLGDSESLRRTLTEKQKASLERFDSHQILERFLELLKMI
jgi:glycosyltransferase involved in cell wall biosynthesis